MLLPFYVATWPEAARALLMYRYHTLPGARAKAVRMGWRGAHVRLGVDRYRRGDHPRAAHRPRSADLIQVLCGTQEQHISADIAYAIWQYWEATGDDVFMVDAGAEILLETARFWASRASPEADGRRHIRGVIGPDEYHETHRRQRLYKRHGPLEYQAWHRDRGAVARPLAGSLGRAFEQLGLDDAELRQWRRRPRRCSPASRRKRAV